MALGHQLLLHPSVSGLSSPKPHVLLSLDNHCCQHPWLFDVGLCHYGRGEGRNVLWIMDKGGQGAFPFRVCVWGGSTHLPVLLSPK